MKTLILILLAVVASAKAGELQVVNVSASDYVYTDVGTGVPITFPKGQVLRIAVTPFWVASVGGTFGTVAAEGATVLTIYGPGLTDYRLEVIPEPNYYVAFFSGMGAGFMWFGFGWCLRLQKKIPEF